MKTALSRKNLVLAALAIGGVAIWIVAKTGSRDGDSEARNEAESGVGSFSPSALQASDSAGGSAEGGDPGGDPGGRQRGGGARSPGQSSGQPSADGPDQPPGEASKGPLQKLFERRAEGVALFDENFELSPEVGEALGLSGPEFLVLNQTLKGKLDEINELRGQNLEVRSRSDSQLFLKIRSFGEQGAEVRTALQDEVRDQLGEEKFSAFMLLTEDSLNSEYFEFGKAYQTISYNFYTSQNTGQERIRIVDEVHVPQGGGQWTIIQNKDNFDALPDRYLRFLEAAGESASDAVPASATAPVENSGQPPATPAQSPSPGQDP